MPDLESVISGALEAATSDPGDGGDGGETDTSTDTSTDTTDLDTSGSDVVTDEGTDTEVEAGSEATAKAEADAKAALAAEEAFAKEHGLLDKAGKRENRVPYPRVKAIVANAEKKLAEAVLGQKLVADKPLGEQLKTFATKYTEVEQENQGLRTQLSEIDQVEQIMLHRPEQFLELLPNINPKFTELLGARGGSKTENTPAPAELPKPDMKYTTPDGKEAMTYSVDGIVGLIKAVVAQTEAKVYKDMDAKVKPFTDREQAAQTEQQILSRLKARVDHARANWEGFKDHEKEIQDALRLDREQAARTRTAPKLDLHDAYISVINKKHKESAEKLKLDREAMRKEIVKEINGRPRSTAAAAGAARRSTGDEGAPKSMEDVIKSAMENSGIK